MTLVYFFFAKTIQAAKALSQLPECRDDYPYIPSCISIFQREAKS
jgi:hypothetical protein